MTKDIRELHEFIVSTLAGPQPTTQDDIERAIRYILQRLGPPEPLDGVDPEKVTEREA